VAGMEVLALPWAPCLVAEAPQLLPLRLRRREAPGPRKRRSSHCRPQPGAGRSCTLQVTTAPTLALAQPRPLGGSRAKAPQLLLLSAQRRQRRCRRQCMPRARR
jgi:hypothetical protein